MDRRATAVLRVNPDLDGGTHAKISTRRRGNKFGVAIADVPAMYDRRSRLEGRDLLGVALHIGSQLRDLAPLKDAYDRIDRLVADLRARGHVVGRVDLGGGLGIPYCADDVVPTLDAYAAMNDLARPALYDALHRFDAVAPDGTRMVANIAGPVCESGDVFAVARDIDRVRRGDLAVLHATGAYGAAMASPYNCRALSPQVLVDGDRFEIVADRYLPEELAA